MPGSSSFSLSITLLIIFYCHQGALFTSEHIDENDVQTIRRKCDVISYEDYLKRKLHQRSGEDRLTHSAFYLAGNYDAARRKIKCVYV